MPFLKFLSQTEIVSSLEDNFQSNFKYIINDSSDKISDSSEKKSLVVVIPGRIDAAWGAEEKEKGRVYNTDKASFGIAINVLKKKISEKRTLLDKDKYVVSNSDDYDFVSEEFKGFHTNLIEI